MLFFYALLFFLFFASVASTPLRSSTPGPGQERRHQGYAIQRAATSLGKRPAPRRPEDGYWVLKRPQQAHRYPERILHINNQVYRVFTLNNQLGYHSDPMEVTGIAKLGLVGTYTQIPTLVTPADRRFFELRISPDRRLSYNLVLEFFDTRGVDWWNPPGGYEVTDQRQVNGYWVLGDMTPHQTTASWFEILHVDNGVFQTFQLANLFVTTRHVVIDATTLAAINAGRHFRIPVHGDGTLPFQRFDILTYQPLLVHPGYSLNIHNQEGYYVDVRQ